VGMSFPAGTSAFVLLQRAPGRADGHRRREGSPMGLGERCDEIVRLIDETLAAFEAEPVDTVTNPPASGPTVTTFPPRRTRTDGTASGF
jgi:hypothetical protein